MPCQRVTSCSIVSRHMQTILVINSCHIKIFVVCIACVVLKVFQVHPQLLGCTIGSETVNLPQSQPVLSSEIPKALFVLCPVTVEAHRSIHPALEHSPSSSIGVHVTVDPECCLVVRFDSVDSTGVLTFLIGILAVKIYCECVCMCQA